MKTSFSDKSLLAKLDRNKGAILYFLLTILMLIVYVQDIPALNNLDYFLEDLVRRTDNFEADNSKITIVGIDSVSIAKVGDWPWDYERISDLLLTICDYEPKAVMLDIPLVEKWEEFVSGNSEMLAQSIAECSNIILPFDIVVSDQGRLSQSAPQYFNSLSYNENISINFGNLPKAAATFAPPQLFAENARGIGFRYYENDRDEFVRTANQIIDFQNNQYFSNPLQAAALYLGIDPKSIIVNDRNILLNNRKIPLNDQGQMLLKFPVINDDYQIHSAIDILTGDALPKTVQGKVVIVTATAKGNRQFIRTSNNESLPSYQYYGVVIQSIIDGPYPSRLTLPLPTDFLLMLIIGSIAVFLLPRISLLYRFIALFALGFILVNLNFIFYGSFNLLIKVLYPTLTVLLYLIASPLVEKIEKIKTLSLGKGINIRELLGNEPLAVHQVGDKKVELDEIPTSILEDSNPPIELFEETIRLDFEALHNGGDLIPEEEYHKRNMKVPKNENEKTVAYDPKPIAEDVDDHTETKIFNPNLLDVDMSGIQQPTAAPEHKVTSDSASPDSTPIPKKDVNQDYQDIILTPSEKERYKVKFSTEGQPLSFGRYLVIEPLGMGAMGTVYKGKDPAIDRLVALKTIRLDTIADPSEMDELKERLVREAKAAGNLSHPNIVTIYDVGMQANLQYIAMEYLEGYTLESMIKRKLKLNYRIVASIIMQVCSALDYAHSLKIVHRDIKPANIMIMDNFSVKVMDYGIAHFESSSMTKTGVAMGTPSYISPEQLQGGIDVTPSSDIFSLGVVLYELLVHRKPFVAENISSLVYKIVNEEPKLPSEIDSTIPALFDMIIKKALAKDPQERYTTAKEMSSAMENFTIASPKSSSVF